jgi:hypothetical protein
MERQERPVMANLWDALILRLGRFLLRLAHIHIG